ncbi:MULTISPECIES: glutamine synthetase III family protein [Psychrilyobacter]|uniref:Glutamine synthetase type III n=1 Tax=Psychrilyobacter piezotolerans TaxID=2293438 RepID=A0ABX9KF87_9FUSO|nr:MULTISPECIES: glutamine synthetase III [Psychrilyobacter]MCS5421682.1 glutamine synthetase III [Psychrilyobacter sp. S5]NDI78814.1 glutamine synthetase type III [Psychrilyobacter piezotolerans]RDE59520.1 glutamine synthetase type III [Psychrilyobacter sp. S5]REI39960.1 glutamine synthetase type III [Psychrilyobacter piezotolerans]
MKKIITETKSLPEIYGDYCFDKTTLRQRVPKSVFKEFLEVQNGRKELTLSIAEVVANAMKDWAIEKGATHYTHWFQPLNGLTAEKHDSFVSPIGDGQIIMEFSGKELIKGESDASSFPSGGLRSTFEARGYTAWDTTSPAFLKDDNTGITLYIPTAFVAYTGEALDKKVPLLRSMNAIEKQALRILRILGNNTSKHITTCLGAEQEYFLVEKNLFNKRLDLAHTGRTLFGAKPAKSQELRSHYYGTIEERVAAFMRELDFELWRLGIPSKTKHNEVAPNQFELAPIYSTTNVATDQNQLVMDTINKMASRHDLVALLHEKPFADVNGSGKHNNWSLATDDGINLFEPGKNPKENAQFLIFIAAVIKAVDKYAPLLRLSTASASNDNRLGGHEAPPAIISIFLGDELETIFKKTDEKLKTRNKLEIGVDSLPKLPMDITDRNRTSPFAFTGNKFEFRMPGSSQSTSTPNVMLNTIMADVLKEFADELEGMEDKTKGIQKLVSKTYKEHKRIIFSGNGYGEEWVKEAEKRGLPNLKSTTDALGAYTTPETIELFGRHGVLSEGELISRYNIYAENYYTQIVTESTVMIKMAVQDIYPASNRYALELAEIIKKSSKILGEEFTVTQEELLAYILKNNAELYKSSKKLEEKLEELNNLENITLRVNFTKDELLPLMKKLRTHGDNLEGVVEHKMWPFPTYEELLFKL